MLRRVAAALAIIALVGTGGELSAQAKKTAPPRKATSFLILGSEANAWNAAAVGINGTSATLDTQWCPYASAFGNTSAAATITVQYSQNNTTFYSSNTNTGAVTGNFGITFQVAARYIRLQSNAAVTITATLACKAQ